ncbi:hypothetical protein C8R44DRAFT_894062 [Mycena epipterygia]|nr:hypothetical protein C8R44DRAFT_894062 [Mycena epipterygia]
MFPPLSRRVSFSSFIFAFIGLRETLPSAIVREQQKKPTPAAETDPLLAGQNTASMSSDTVLPLRDLLTRPICLVLIDNALLAFCEMAFDSLLTLVCALSPTYSAHMIPDYQRPAAQILRPRRIFNAAFCALALAFLGCPLLSLLAKRAGRMGGAVVTFGCNLQHLDIYVHAAEDLSSCLAAVPSLATLKVEVPPRILFGCLIEPSIVLHLRSLELSVLGPIDYMSVYAVLVSRRHTPLRSIRLELSVGPHDSGYGWLPNAYSLRSVLTSFGVAIHIETPVECLSL